jgi:hypothetical protein
MTEAMAGLMSDTAMQQPDHNELASSGWTAKDSNLGSKETPLGMAITISHPPIQL